MAHSATFPIQNQPSSDGIPGPWRITGGRPLALAGQNVLLAYLISEMLPSLLDVLHLGGGYGHLAANLPSAIARSASCGLLILLVSTGLNRIGFRLKL
ncbi:MAG: hypothetical protein ABSF95_02385 [Verrucomicrobiota bacterium]|jgi:hypothetical protein